MFKTDKKTLERLSFDFSEREIASLKSVLKYLSSNDLLTIPREDVQRVLEGLDEIGRLKLDGKTYAFHVYDSYADLQSGNGEGVELYLRQGDELREFHVPGSRDSVYSEYDAIEFLKKEDIFKVYTGDICLDSGFLGLLHGCDPDYPINRGSLEDEEVSAFNSRGIEVVRLDSLI